MPHENSLNTVGLHDKLNLVRDRRSSACREADSCLCKVRLET